MLIFIPDSSADYSSKPQNSKQKTSETGTIKMFWTIFKYFYNSFSVDWLSDWGRQLYLYQLLGSLIYNKTSFINTSYVLCVKVVK